MWSGLRNGDSGQWYLVTCAKYPDKCVQVIGTFGTGGTVVIEGSNQYDNITDYSTLSDSFGDSLVFGASDIKQINQNPLAIRPRVTAGDSSTNVTILIAMRD
ncbi:MAG: hypothetical protein K6T85_01710 [Gorillibacterium sp.]|nr:hypothetical protein [Gorillibacterium sp.]